MTQRQVIVGVDGSAAAVQALDRAAEEAALRGAGLEVVYAVSDADEAGPVLESALSRVRRRHPRLAVTGRAVVDDPARALARLGRDAALTVVGTRGLGGVAGVLVGSVGLRLAAHLPGPLLVVRGHRPVDAARRGLHEVLLGLHGAADAEAASYAFTEAERRGARLRVLHVRSHREAARAAAGGIRTATEGTGEDTALRARAELDASGRFLAHLRERHPAVGVRVQDPDAGPVPALLEATTSADTVVVAVHRPRGLRLAHLDPAHLDPVAHALLHHSACPVVLVPDRG